jgi:hypothetical protein
LHQDYARIRLNKLEHKQSRHAIANHAIGTVLQRKSKAGGREYTSLWIYLPNSIAEDSNFPFKGGDPVEINLSKDGELALRPISETQAVKEGWSRRKRKTQA